MNLNKKNLQALLDGIELTNLSISSIYQQQANKIDGADLDEARLIAKIGAKLALLYYESLV